MRVNSGAFTYVTAVIKSFGSLKPSGSIGIETAPVSSENVPVPGI